RREEALSPRQVNWLQQQVRRLVAFGPRISAMLALASAPTKPLRKPDMRYRLISIPWRAGTIVAAFLSPSVCAQSNAPPVPLEPITVTATRHEERAFDVPASVDIITGEVIRDGNPAVNLSETLARVPGVFAANRQNYAQDLQISSRGFGARAAFGVRGVRLYQDGIPVTMPDGQGQTGSFSLLSAERVEVLRGPFSTLYGNASGGVISVFSEIG